MLGLVIATQLGWHDVASIALAIVLAFVFGSGLTVQPLLSSGLALRAALGLAFAADALSITVMEIVDNTIVVLIPGAMNAAITDNAVLGKPGALVGRGRSGGLPSKPMAHPTGARARGHPRAPLRFPS